MNAAAGDGSGTSGPPGSGDTRVAWSTRRGIALAVFGVCLAVYLALYLLVPQGRGMRTRTGGDEPHYLIMAESIIEDGDLSLENNYDSREYERKGYYRQLIIYPHLVFGRDRRVVPSHSVLPTLVILPGFAIAGWRGAGVTMILIMSAAALFVFLLLERFTGERKAAAITAFFFLTYPLLAYSHLVYPEVAALLLITVALWAALKVKDGKGAGYLLLGGLATAALPFLHAKFLVFSVALSLLTVLCARERPSMLAYYFAPLGASLVLLVFWTWYLYGPNIIHGLTVSSGEGGVFGPGSPWGIFGLYIDRTWGLLPYAPLYIVFFAGVSVARTRSDIRRWWIFIPATIVLYTLVVGSFKNWEGGVSPAPRYLVPLMPLFILCASLVLAGAKRTYPRVLLLLIALLQLVLTVYTRVIPAAVMALPMGQNQLYAYMTGNSRFCANLQRVFPLLHPVTFRGIVLIVLWCVFITALIYSWRRFVSAPPGEIKA